MRAEPALLELKLNYRFSDPVLADGPIAPVYTKAKVAPARQQWEGLYGGLHGGVVIAHDPALDTTLIFAN